MGGGTDLLTVTHDAGIVVDGRDRLMALLSRTMLQLLNLRSRLTGVPLAMVLLPLLLLLLVVRCTIVWAFGSCLLVVELRNLVRCPIISLRLSIFPVE
ncbi:unnamed protein product (mitochondrion) [Plasmodiophora brassicae]|uniref:Uncharacterized protein n=1 Tax=Plasmodiophora brassicae TaxID=37360 RepID=A0A3P3YPL0_PLABS|nr:unnamed protein product [Plasmodiophora brassicae]